VLLSRPKILGLEAEGADPFGAPTFVTPALDPGAGQVDDHGRFQAPRRQLDSEFAEKPAVHAPLAEASYQGGADVEPVPPALVERGAPAGHIVPFEHQNSPAGEAEAGRRGKTRNSGTDHHCIEFFSICAHMVTDWPFWSFRQEQEGYGKS
jgi:hypothetical protein